LYFASKQRQRSQERVESLWLDLINYNYYCSKRSSTYSIKLLSDKQCHPHPFALPPKFHLTSLSHLIPKSRWSQPQLLQSSESSNNSRSSHQNSGIERIKHPGRATSGGTSARINDSVRLIVYYYDTVTNRCWTASLGGNTGRFCTFANDIWTLAGPIVGERGAIAWTDAHARALRARRGEYRVVCTAKKGYDSEEIELHFYSCLCTVVSSLMWRRGQLLERERQLTSTFFVDKNPASCAVLRTKVGRTATSTCLRYTRVGVDGTVPSLLLPLSSPATPCGPSLLYWMMSAWVVEKIQALRKSPMAMVRISTNASIPLVRVW